MDWFTGMTFFVSPYSDERRFADGLLQRAGIGSERRVALNLEASTVVSRLADLLDNNTPDWTTPNREASGSTIVEQAVRTIVTGLPPEKAFAALRGLRPDLQRRNGALGELKPVARAALARELRAIGGGLMQHLVGTGRFVNTDIDESKALQREPVIQPGASRRRN